MGCMLRSDPMTECEVFLQPETSFSILSRLGEEGCVQFTDLNEGLNLFQRAYILEICRCAEMERKLRYIGEKMEEDEIFVPKAVGEPPALELHEMPEYEVTIAKWERLITEMTANMSQLSKTYLDLSQMSYVLSDVAEMLGDADLNRQSALGAIKNTQSKGKGTLKAGPAPDTGGRLIVITGLVQRRRSYSFQLMLWRLSLGNIYYKQTEQDRIFKDPTMNNMDVRKVAFLLVVQGEELGERMKKVCEGFRCDLYPLPSTESERIFALEQVNLKVMDLHEVLTETKYLRCKAMRSMAKTYSTYLIRIKKAKAIYYTMSMCTLDITKNCLIGQVWIPDADLGRVQDIFSECSRRFVPNFWISNYLHFTTTAYWSTSGFVSDNSRMYFGQQYIFPERVLHLGKIILGLTHKHCLTKYIHEQHKMETAVESFLSKLDTLEIPPTFHRTNRFTHGFQALISAYGESTYRELNPGLYTIITFPFLFSLMFGDMGHGAIMFAAALWMILNEKKFIAEKSDSEIWNIFFGGRYIMLMMSLFSIYAGWIYNDCFSKSFTIFESGWKSSKTLSELSKDETFLLELQDHSRAYYFGRDPMWELAENKILFENSLKMKLSIIIGVIHMLFGETLGFINDEYFHKKYLIFLEFIPQILFLLCIFFWLVILIFTKWFIYGGGQPATFGVSQGCAPLVLILFIDMVLMSESKPVGESCDAYMFKGQKIIQQTLLFIAVISVPIMLFGPPCVEFRINKKKVKKLLLKAPNQADDPRNYEEWKKQVQHLSEPFSDLMIHQAVATIEFVLSTVSHTASYLRLWALSLAHAQLSEMLWAMVLSKLALRDHSTYGGFMIVAIFAVWAVFTLSILVLMEGLSAFLHTLRLHWVEFMSKFFKGTGYFFNPFSFAALLAETGKHKNEVCPTSKAFDY